VSELRRNLATDEWIIIAGERAKRPSDFAREGPGREALPEYAPDCPFCAGNEVNTPAERLRIGDDGGWQVRVIPNKFPALAWDGRDSGAAQRHCDDWRMWMQGVGDHEVIIESPRHNLSPASMPPNDLARVIAAYRERYLDLDANRHNELIIIFRNHGARAGTSLVHPHSQLIATPVVPAYVRQRVATGMRHFDETGHCVYCDLLRWEIADAVRVVAETDQFAAFCPYASSVPYEVWIVPRRHDASFGDILPEEMAGLAGILHDVLARMAGLLSDPDYNYVIHTAPQHSGAVPYYHWHVQIMPRLTTPAGFEIGSGMNINIMPPDAAAEALREGTTSGRGTG
jgi:UDPglucose--hexose-1-phosphate uridylyltransferase